VPPNGKPSSIAPSLLPPKKGVGTDVNGTVPLSKATSFPEGTHPVDHQTPPYPYDTAIEPGNPSVVPLSVLKKFHWTFLIRHPRYSIPSYYRCTIPPLDAITGFYNFMPSEAGYDELRRLFDYLKAQNLVGPAVAGKEGSTAITGHTEDKVDICLIDADELLDEPAEVIEGFCKSVGIDYSPGMLSWDTEEDHALAKKEFLKWKGFHEDAIDSTKLKKRTHVSLAV
jgi:hypothetical protein